MNAVAYLRVSGTSQTDGDGFHRQSEAIQRFTDSNGHQLVATFFEAFTGTREDRPALLAMLDYCADNDIKTVIVERMDRLARKYSTGIAIAQMFRQRGIQCISATTGDVLTDEAPDPDNWFIGALSLLMAEWDKRKVVHRMGEAKKRIRANGGKCDGRKGYRELAPEILQRATELRNNGLHYYQIANQLQDEGRTTLSGKPWHHNTIRKMLSKHTTTETFLS